MSDLICRSTSASLCPKVSRYAWSALRTSFSSSSVSSMVCMDENLTPRRRFVPAEERRAEHDVLEPVVARDRHPPRLGVDADDATRPELELLLVEAHRSAALDDEIDLLLPRFGVVVLASLLVRWEDEVVEAEGAPV